MLNDRQFYDNNGVFNYDDAFIQMSDYAANNDTFLRRYDEAFGAHNLYMGYKIMQLTNCRTIRREDV